MNLPLVFAVIGIGGFASGTVARLVKLPMITRYLVAGIVMGPTVSGLLSEAWVAGANVLVTPIGLGIIGYLIGGSLPMAGIREGGRSIPLLHRAPRRSNYSCWRQGSGDLSDIRDVF